MVTDAKHAVRLSVKLGKALNSSEKELLFRSGGREVRLTPGAQVESLSDSQWVVFTTGGFDAEEDAFEFGERLRRKLELAAVRTLLGADAGTDVAVERMSEEWARQNGWIGPGDRLLPNIHGVSVFPDDGRTRFPATHMTGKALRDPASLVAALEGFPEVQPRLTTGTEISLLLLNRALMEEDNVSRIVIAFAAVEGLGQEEWSADQRRLLNELATTADGRTDVPGGEEVAAALRSGTHRLSLRQGVLRVLARLGLNHLKKPWDRLYGGRSALVHGLKPMSDRDVLELSIETTHLCCEIVLRAAEREGVAFPRMDATFPLDAWRKWQGDDPK